MSTDSGPDQFAGQQFGGGGSGASANICAQPTYATRQDLEYVYGKDNVKKWADVDNLGVDDDIQERICWALAESRAYVDSRLRGGPYAIPFTEPYDYQVVSMSARYAGVLLYESRGITDFAENGRPQHQLSMHRTQVTHWLQQVLAGLQRLNAVQRSNTPASVPYTTGEEEPIELEDFFKDE